ncbi:MAG: hypothetical protein LBG64_00155 [Pseudomonadales bacterium]|jgi:hypothetical protein|nr:hypothetical protein [Pseudomonadales bacterium]
MSKTATKRSAVKSAPKKTAVKSKVKKSTTPKKVDVVEEVKQELIQEERKVAASKTSKFGGGLSWGVLILILIVIFGGMHLWRFVRLQRIKAELPPIITELGGGMELVEMRNWTFRGGVWEFEIVFAMDGEEIPFTSYISEDGNLLFTSGIDIDEFRAEMEMWGEGGAAQQGAGATCEDVTMADIGQVDVFVDTACPFGLQMIRAATMGVNELPALGNNVTLRYINVVGGDEENMRQLCIREEQPNVFWQYAACYILAGDTEGCLATTGVNVATLNSCVEDANRGQAFVQIDAEMAFMHGVTGTPSTIINNADSANEGAFGGRSADALRQMVCCSSENEPEFCATPISTDQAIPSFGEQAMGADATTASCA